MNIWALRAPTDTRLERQVIHSSKPYERQKTLWLQGVYMGTSLIRISSPSSTTTGPQKWFYRRVLVGGRFIMSEVPLQCLLSHSL